MQEKQNNTALVWFRNDLRVHDNVILKQAIDNHEQVIATYCFDPRLFKITQYGFKKTEKFRAKFLIESVQNLKDNLKELNIELFVFQNKPEESIPQVLKDFDITSVYVQKEWTREELDVLKNVKSTSPSSVRFKDYYDQFLYHPEDIQIDFKQIPQVFTYFRKHVEKHANIRSEIMQSKGKSVSGIVNKTKIPSLQELGFEDFNTPQKTAFPFEGGETAALKRLEYYIFQTKKIGNYKKTRNGLIGIDYSSKFSAWLANGSLSPRTIYWAIKAFEKEHFKNESTYWLIFELIWRDYFKYISLKHGNNIFKIGGILEKSYNWFTSEQFLNDWINGETQSSFVNANMLELQATGWMSNRGRQNVASFFAKDLKMDWRIGAAYFESQLIDYDVHSNYGNWMYVAGVGNDPRDRTFNVNLQAESYDSNGTFQNLWLQKTLF